MVPATSSPLANALSIKGGGMDINAACAGFTYGLVSAAGFIATGAERVLLIGSETLTRITNWSDRTNAFLFGDGAGAVVVEAVPGEPALLGWDIGVDGSLQPLFYSDYGGPGMAMRGQEVFRKAVRVTVDSATKSLERAKLTPSDVALFVPHQANMRIMDAVAERLGLPAGAGRISNRAGRQHLFGLHPDRPHRRRQCRAASGRRHRPVRRLRRRDDVGVGSMALGGRPRTLTNGQRLDQAEPRAIRVWPTRSRDMEEDMAGQMGPEESFDVFKQCAVEVLQVEPSKIVPEARFADDLDADSLDLVELVMALEERFGIDVPESELEGVQTVGQAYELVASKL